MKYLRTYESRVFLDFFGPHNTDCQVCGGDSDNYREGKGVGYFRSYFKCNTCGFDWYSEYSEDVAGFTQFEGRYMLDGTEIRVGEVAPNDQYSEVNIETNRYNI